MANASIPSAPAQSMNWRRYLTQETILFFTLIVIVIVLSLLSDRFLTTANLLNQTRLYAEIALMALPMTLIIITAGIDLSVSSTFGWAAVMLGWSWSMWGLPLPVAMGVSLLTGLVAGLFNGIIIARVRVPPLITTLATLAIYRGMAYGISKAQPISGYPDWFEFFGQGDIGPLPTQFVILIVMTIIVGVFLARTPWGRYIYATGSNPEAARFSGIPVQRILMSIYAFSGVMAGLAAIIFVSRVTTTRADAGVGTELDVIAAVVLGGTSIYGGKGTIIGTILGWITIALLRNGLALAGVKGDATVVVIGAVLIFAVFVNRILRGEKGDAR
jgi:rhamnose transport system permease protein